jgi:hypothetical protein
MPVLFTRSLRRAGIFGMTQSLADRLEGKAIRCAGEKPDQRIYLVKGGQKKWIMTPADLEALGFSFEDVVVISDAELQAIPTSPMSIGQSSPFHERDAIRYQVSNSYLSGSGIEIGAGLFPQRLPDEAQAVLFELRDVVAISQMFDAEIESVPEFFPMDQIREHYPEGADFLIAHNVLEHCPNPIGTLVEWVSHVRDEGVVVVSVPDAQYCPDRERLVAGIDHILDDYLFGRDADTFESREHSYSCTFGWMNDSNWEDWLPLSKEDVSKRAHAAAHMDALDVHWHAFTPDLFRQVVAAASFFSEREFQLLALADPHSRSGSQTAGDIIAILRISRSSIGARGSGLGESIEAELRAVEQRLKNALQQLRGREGSFS